MAGSCGDDVVYMAVGNDVNECRLNLVYAIKHLGGRRICILHVHEPAKLIPFLGTQFLASSMKEKEVNAYRERERQDANKILDGFLFLCHQAGVRAEKLYVESDKIKKGIVELVSLHGIRRLIMGAAADKYYSRKMTKIRSKKAMYVHLKAPAFCQIQFVCNGQLIRTREACPQEAHVDIPPPSPQSQNVNGACWRPVESGQFNGSRIQSPSIVLERLSISKLVSNDSGTSSPFERSYSPSSSSGCLDAASSRTEEDEYGVGLSSPLLLKDVAPNSSPLHLSGFQQDESADDILYIQLEKSITEAANAKREAFREAVKRAQAENELGNAIFRAKFYEDLYAGEARERKDVEEALSKEREELENVKNQVNKMMEELQVSRNRGLELENQIAGSDQMVKELEQKILSAIELLHNYKNDRDVLLKQRDEALKEVDDIRTRQVEARTKHTAQVFSEFSFSEIAEATRKFDPSLKIGEGTHGSMYKGLLYNTEVCIKMFGSHSLQNPVEFQREVDVLSILRHPNIATLIGVCPEACVLVYDYFPNGSLEDRLACKDNSSPLSWKTRIRIASELCSALIFIHSNKICKIIHGDLKPLNVLLDANYVPKLAGFGSCHFLPHDEKLSYNENIPAKYGVKSNHEFPLTTKLDVFSFGMVLLSLLTGKSYLRMKEDVQFAVEERKLKNVLDPRAGDWPFVQAEQLAQLALRCCNRNSMYRPDLVSDVWRVLEPMKASCGGSVSVSLSFGDLQVQPPPYFLCPIFQEVMEDPHVAADGFTYEAEALRGWLDSGHNTSPMTNLRLEHQNLVPNRALRSVIQEWLHQQQ
ncbi:U-box domain-containing protein 33-like isoform X1 [Cucurbita pepo subsp. pepo]|uniref:U-box domain-containing protein 33-like isoform X1 n=2 Tax=Cucurbita pepo subsp. pepo TaxID=3664 RepID=UPI000C9D5B62|nr:U-box domain-containing protein 33-like isoform X1 [Cucurbita pepo subsp. pepo]